MKKSTLIKWHLYCGLFTAFYLLAFGFSSILLNHKIATQKKEVTNEWSKIVQINQDQELTDLARDVQYQLGLMGWLPGWQFQKDSLFFKFQVVHPGRDYHLELNLRDGQVNVQELPKGFWYVFQNMHFFNGRIPNSSWFLKTFAGYQWVALLVLLFSIVLGIWLWLKFAYRTWEVIVFGIIFIFSVFIMLIL